MRHLRLEILEARQLLSGFGANPPRPSAPPPQGAMVQPGADAGRQQFQAPAPVPSPDSDRPSYPAAGAQTTSILPTPERGGAPAPLVPAGPRAAVLPPRTEAWIGQRASLVAPRADADRREAEAVDRPLPELSGKLPPSPPQVSDRLWEALPFDLGLLEGGVERFLERLGSVGAQLAGSESGWGLAPWAVAAAVAALAAEIARRQLQQHEQRPGGDLGVRPGAALPL